MVKMLLLEMSHAWNMLALLVPSASPVFVYVHTLRMMQKSLHTVCCCLRWVVLASPLNRSLSQSVVFPEVFF